MIPERVRRSITVVSCAGVLLLVASLLPAAAAAQIATRTVTGRVLSLSDSTALPGVRISLLGRAPGASTGSDGRFRLDGLPAASVQLVFERIGLVPDTVSVAADVQTVTVYLRLHPVLLAPLITQATPIARERFELIAQTSTVSLEPLEIKEAPGIGEPDVARVVQLLPGTVAKNDYSTGFNVRGGEADQNLIRLDGITVFNPSHLGGLFSTFDPAAVERVDFITGGFPAGFGGRLSSVLDVGLKDGDPSRTHATGAVSLISSKLMVDGPVPGTGVRYVLAGRRTYADAFADKFTDDTFGYYFGDALGKLTVPTWGRGTVSATGYWGRDNLVLQWVTPEPGRDGVDIDFDWGNRLAGVTWRQPVGRFVFEQRASVSEFSTHFGLSSNEYGFSNTARLYALETGVGASPGGGHQLRLGGSMEAYRLAYAVDAQALGDPGFDLRYAPRVWAGYVDDQWQPVRWLLVRPGVRVEHVGRGANFTGVAPRIAAKVFLTHDFAVTGSAGRYYQAIHSIRDQEQPITVFDVWIGANDVTPVARADHVVLGFERWFGERTSLSVEGYTKKYENVLIRNRLDDPGVTGDEFITANGYARGVDVLLRRHVGTVTGWIAYSYSKTIRRTATDTFPPAHDRRHSLNVVVQSPGPWGSRMGVRWGYGSPMPYTGIVGQWLHRYYDPATNQFSGWEEEPIAGVIDGERYPYYSRLDVSFRWQFDWLGGVWEPYLQVANVYNRQNVFVYTFDYSSVPPTRSGYTQLPILPTFGVEFRW